MQSNHTKFKTNLVIFLLVLKSLCACANIKQGLAANNGDTINPLVHTKPDNFNHTSGICDKKSCIYCKNDHKHGSCNSYNCYYGHHKCFSYTRDFCWGTTNRKIVSIGTGLLSLVVATAPMIYYSCSDNTDGLKTESSLMHHTYNQTALVSSDSASTPNITGDVLGYVMTTALPTLGTIAALLPNQFNANRVTTPEPVTTSESVETSQPTTSTDQTMHFLGIDIDGEFQSKGMSLNKVSQYFDEGRIIVNTWSRSKDEKHAYSILQYAAYNHKLDVVKFLIEKGVDVNAQNTSLKATALHIAAHTKNFEIVDYLLKHGAKSLLKRQQ